MAYCCYDFVVNQRKALLTNYLALLCYNSRISTWHRDISLFQSANRSWILTGSIDQDGPIHGVGGFARFVHFKTII